MENAPDGNEPYEAASADYRAYASGQWLMSELRLIGTSLILRKSVMPHRRIIKFVPGSLRADKDVVAGRTLWVTVYRAHCQVNGFRFEIEFNEDIGPADPAKHAGVIM